MVHRLIGMIIIIMPHHIRRYFIKEGSQVCQYLFFASHQGHHTRHILRHKPTLLVRTAFNGAIALLHAAILWPILPAAVIITRTEPVLCRIKYVAVVTATRRIYFFI